jgi:Na+/citrate or Na+/malate symporter
MFRPDTRKSGRSIVINTMPVIDLYISYVIDGIIMSMYRNIGSDMDTKMADMAITVMGGMVITAAIETTTGVTVGMARANITAEVTTEINQDQLLDINSQNR